MKRWATVAMLLSGCLDYGTMTEVRISSALTDDEIAIVEGAVAEWCTVSEDTCFPVSVVDSGANVVRLRQRPGDWTGGCSAFTRYPNGTTRIELLPECTMRRSGMLHEIGHALGQPEHLPDPEHAMHGRPSVECLSQEDVEFVCAARGVDGCVPTCKPGSADSGH